MTDSINQSMVQTHTHTGARCAGVAIQTYLWLVEIMSNKPSPVISAIATLVATFSANETWCVIPNTEVEGGVSYDGAGLNTSVFSTHPTLLLLFANAMSISPVKRGVAHGGNSGQFGLASYFPSYHTIHIADDAARWHTNHRFQRQRW